MELNPATLSIAERSKLLTGCIVPRPIAWVSTVSSDGRVNLAPYSFYNGVGTDPMMLLFCPANKPDGSEKDSLRNAKPPAEGGLGEFVVNVVPHRLGPAMALSAEPLPYGESEFELAGIATASSLKVRPPRVALSPVAFECRTTQVLRIKPGAPSGANIVIGEVVHVHAEDGLIDARMHVNAAKLDALGRLAGIAYCTTRERLELVTGKGKGGGGG